MQQKRKFLIIILAIVLLVGLLVLAAKMDDANKNPSNDPAQGSAGSSESKPGIGKDKWDVTLEEWKAMTGAEQEAFFYSFDSSDDYFKWFNAAKKADDNDGNNIIIGGDNSVNLGDILNGNK